MTLDQGLAFAIILGTIAMFVWGRLPYDLVSLLSLLAGIAVGIIPAHHAFEGFSSDVVIIIGTALLVSAAVARSGVVETAMRPVLPYLTSVHTQVPVLVAAVTLLSMCTKNVGALAILMPVAFQLARRTGTSPSCLLMPMAFGSLLGGLVTLVGTSPNIIVSQLRAELFGRPFGMFDFTPVGLAVAGAGVLFLAFGYRLLPTGQRAAASMDAAFTIESYVTEARLPPDSPMVHKTVAELEALGDSDVRVTTVIREKFRRYTPTAQWTLHAGDLLLLKGEAEDLERVIARAQLRLPAAEDAPAAPAPSDKHGVVEGVITADSPLIGRSPAQVHLRQRYGVNLLALSRSGRRITQRLRSLKFRLGDVLVLQGERDMLREALGELGVLPLAQRNIALGQGRRGYLPVFALGLAMVLVALHVVPVAVAFFGAAVVILLFRSLTLREAYDAMEWPVLILMGALIPVSEAVRRTGGTDLVAGWISGVVDALPPLGALAVMMVAAMFTSPFLHNAPTVLVLGPIAASLAGKLGLNADPFLMAVATGAASDFLTPIGHQCNTLVWGPGGYRFSDYWRLGFPLSFIVVLVGAPLIALVWPLTPG